MELTFWVTPFTTLKSRAELLDSVRSHTPEDWHPNVLIPTHYGGLAQADVRQSLPADLLVGSPASVADIRGPIEEEGVGFGVWGVPRSQDDAELAAMYALAGGFYVANTERGADFSEAILTFDGLVSWWTSFWNIAGDAMDGAVYATLVPNTDTMNLGDDVLAELAGGCNALALETYGGPNTPEYPFPSLWPRPSFGLVNRHVPGHRLVPILALGNLTAQLVDAQHLGAGEVQVWAL